MYPIFKPIDWKHFAPELLSNSEPWFYKHFVPTGLFKKVTTQRSPRMPAVLLTRCNWERQTILPGR